MPFNLMAVEAIIKVGHDKEEQFSLFTDASISKTALQYLSKILSW